MILSQVLRSLFAILKQVSLRSWNKFWHYHIMLVTGQVSTHCYLIFAGQTCKSTWAEGFQVISDFRISCFQISDQLQVRLKFRLKTGRTCIYMWMKILRSFSVNFNWNLAFWSLRRRYQKLVLPRWMENGDSRSGLGIVNIQTNVFSSPHCLNLKQENSKKCKFILICSPQFINKK